MTARPKSDAATDGYVDLPPGKIAAVATYLDMGRPASLQASALPAGARLEPLRGQLGRYRTLYAEVGADWLWFSRAAIAEWRLAAILGDPKVQALAYVVDGRDAGLVELDFRQPPDCELSFFGLVPDVVGRGHGRALIRQAIRHAFARRPIDRLWLHTCTLDHPAALPFYVRSGFRPYRRAVEIADDPRLTGVLPRGSAPYLPIIE